MKKVIWLIMTCLVCLSMGVEARDTREKFPIENAMNQGKSASKISDSVKFYFGKQSHPAVANSFGRFTSNKKTNAVGKSDEVACNWVFLSAILSLQQRALKLGGDGVINIRSYYKKNNFESATEFECGAGNIMAGVALTGEVVKFK